MNRPRSTETLDTKRKSTSIWLILFSNAPMFWTVLYQLMLALFCISDFPLLSLASTRTNHSCARPRPVREQMRLRRHDFYSFGPISGQFCFPFLYPLLLKYTLQGLGWNGMRT